MDCIENKRVLVACSDLDFLLISKILQKGFVLDHANNQDDIMKKRQANAYDLLLIDICFLKPQYEFAKQLQYDKVNLVALSSEPGDVCDRKLMDTGCKACYIKPLRFDSFALFVEYWCCR